MAEIAANLEALEETIIFKILDRAQFALNQEAYEKGQSGFPAKEESLFALRLRAQEEMDSRFGRFGMPEERPFTSNLPEALRPPAPLHRAFKGVRVEDVSVSHKILEAYLGLLPEICTKQQDGHLGSSVEHDVYALQAVSRRVHYGAFFVAESKFRERPGFYCKLIREDNKKAVMQALTRKEVEERILQRIREKTELIQSRFNLQVRSPLNPELIIMFYEKYIIPLTKEGELLYLFQRGKIKEDD